MDRSASKKQQELQYDSSRQKLSPQPHINVIDIAREQTEDSIHKASPDNKSMSPTVPIMEENLMDESSPGGEAMKAARY